MVYIPQKINPIPPSEIIDEWQKDYEIMQGSMLYGENLSFSELIERIEELKKRFKSIG